MATTIIVRNLRHCRTSSHILTKWRPDTAQKRWTVRARAHWQLCLATCGRVFVADPSTLGRHVCYVCKVCKRSVCGGDEPQPVAHLSHKLQCARQSLKIMVSYGNKYPRHNARPHVVEQSGQCARALIALRELMHSIKGEPELTDPFYLLINDVKLRMLWNWNVFYLKEEDFYGNIVS